MPLSLYSHHQRGCEAQLLLEEKTCEFEERKGLETLWVPHFA
jgi:hypothetical protein